MSLPGFRSSRPRFRRRAGRWGASLVLLLLMVATPLGVFAVQQGGLDSPSPATGNAEVIAQGVSPFPAQQVAWRLVTDIAEPRDEVEPESRALGFALADEDAIVVNDYTTGLQQRLAPGEASFVSDQAFQSRHSAGESNVSYYRIALIEGSQASDAGGDELVFGGDPFAAADGNFDIDLVGGTLQAGEETTIDGGEFPVMVLTTSGEVEVDTGGEPTVLAAGEAAQFDGELTIVNSDSGDSRFVATVIGPDVPFPPRINGTVSLGVYTCPEAGNIEGVRQGDEATLASCEALTSKDEFSLDLLDAENEQISWARTRATDDGVYTWSGLPFGTYSFESPPTYPDGYNQHLLLDVDGGETALDEPVIELSRDIPDVRFNIYLFPAAAGQIVIEFRTCPAELSRDDLGTISPEDCELSVELFDYIQLVGNGEDGLVLDMGDGAGSAGILFWSVPFADDETQPEGTSTEFTVQLTELPEGYSDFVVIGPEGLESPEPYVASVTTDNPELGLVLYAFTGGEPTTGEIQMVPNICEAAPAPGETCTVVGAQPIDSFNLLDAETGEVALTLDQAEGAGDGAGYVYTWLGVEPGTYVIDGGSITPPEGYVLHSVANDANPDDPTTFTISEDVTSVVINLYFVPVSEPTDEDTDGDGLTDTEEGDIGTDPGVADTDEDGLSDGQEANETGTDPTSFDTDGDGVGDGEEIDAGTDPLTPDT